MELVTVTACSAGSKNFVTITDVGILQQVFKAVISHLIIASDLKVLYTRV